MSRAASLANAVTLVLVWMLKKLNVSDGLGFRTRLRGVKVVLESRISYR